MIQKFQRREEELVQAVNEAIGHLQSNEQRVSVTAITRLLHLSKVAGIFPSSLREMGLSPNLEKSTIKLEKRHKSALTLEKGLSMKSYLHIVSTLGTFLACLWLEE